MLQLTSDEICALRARAHTLKPVVSIAENGPSEAVLKEIDVSLKAHELIKIRIYSDDREERETHLKTICEQLDAAPIQHIGKLLVIWRPSPEDETKSGKPRRKAARQTKRSFQGT